MRIKKNNFVVSSNGKLLGSFSDGDLRRLLTSGKNLISKMKYLL
ncbi:MAG: hypothetical protein CM15mP29_3720 [Alphaproteobacteria bacterium]|nr:MAG: hypothetical protein CM15mP29_3720 [Alphaproteobacteria bacterium]